MRENAVRRAWGHYVDHHREERCVMKTMYFIPGMHTSLQHHYMRAEFWHVTEGSGFFVIGDLERPVMRGDVALIPIGVKHQIKAGPNGLVVAEMQFGPKCSEDDIVRYT